MRSPAIQQQLVGYLPNLRAFAVSLCRDSAQADDLVQDTILSAWQHWDRFQEGTNLRAWLFTILRNKFLTNVRKQREEVSIDGEGTLPYYSLTAQPAQTSWMDSRDFLKALKQVPTDQREALVLVGAEGFSYEEAAEICGCAIGTIKSRVHRARARLLELLDGGASDRQALPGHSLKALDAA